MLVSLIECVSVLSGRLLLQIEPACSIILLFGVGGGVGVLA
jgi:hypothetical protein